MDEKKADYSLAVAALAVVGIGVALAALASSALQSVIAPPPKKPVVWHDVVSVKPDSVYAASPASAPEQKQTVPDSDNIIFFAPASATLPVLLNRVDAVFPKGARGQCESTVPLLITINQAGKPVNPAFRQKPGCGMDQPALEAVMNWRFRPAEMDGKTLSSGALVEVRFR